MGTPEESIFLGLLTQELGRLSGSHPTSLNLLHLSCLVHAQGLGMLPQREGGEEMNTTCEIPRVCVIARHSRERWNPS